MEEDGGVEEGAGSGSDVSEAAAKLVQLCMRLAAALPCFGEVAGR
jgi:hypothetical protein